MIKNSFKACKNCGHTMDWHFAGDLFYQIVFGVKMTDCKHYTKDYRLPIWKRKKIYCDCECFVKGRLDDGE